MKWLLSVSRVVAWLTLTVLLIATWLSPRPGSRPPSDYTVLKDISYLTSEQSPYLDLYLPVSAHLPEAGGDTPPHPVILAIHGGSWKAGSKADFGPQLARFLQHGYVLVVPDFRLARPGEPSWPRALDDLREAVRWVRRNASRFGLDQDRIVALGSGAGGHLAAMLGLAPETPESQAASPRVQAVVDFCGPTDLPDLLEERRLEHDPIADLTAMERPGALNEASPVEYVSADDPPVLIIHGLDDLWVPPDQARRLAARLTSIGVKHRLLLLPGARHGFGLEVRTSPQVDLLPEILAFLKSAPRTTVRP